MPPNTYLNKYIHKLCTCACPAYIYLRIGCCLVLIISSVGSRIDTDAMVFKVLTNL